MSVPAGERGAGKFDAIVKAMDLADYVITITKNPHSFPPEYQTALTDDIIRMAKDIYIDAWKANNIRVEGDADRWRERSELQEESILNCTMLLALIQLARKVFHLKAKRIKYWGTKVLEVRTLLRNWHEADQRRYGELLK